MEDISVEHRGQTIVATITLAEMTLFNSVAVKQELEGAIADDSDHFIIDLSEVDYIDSSGLGVIISVKTKMGLQYGHVYLVGANHNVKKILKMTRLDKTVKTFESIPEAMHHVEAG